MKDEEIKAKVRDCLTKQEGTLMVCGNKNTLGKSVLEELSHLMTKDEIE